MADRDETTTDTDDDAELRGNLARRLLMAGVLVAVLLGVLAFFDHLASQPEEPEAPVFTEPVPVGPKKEVSQPVTPVEDPSEAPAASDETAEAPPPVIELNPAATPGSEAQTTPAASHPASKPPAKSPAPVAEETAPPEVVAPPSTTPAAPVAPAAKQPPTARAVPGFVLQAGVFANPQLAEELRAKLALSGVPANVETRVQVGPFRTRREAEAAQARLKEQGIQTILVVGGQKTEDRRQ
ncbi:MAG: SPOR domain-containing protein [Azonexus sp.]|jgi:DedD protein|nr:SPOR domain-containing protein [Azonexus sp.]